MPYATPRESRGTESKVIIGRIMCDVSVCDTRERERERDRPLSAEVAYHDATISPPLLRVSKDGKMKESEMNAK